MLASAHVRHGFGTWTPPLLGLSPEHAATIAGEGLDKQHIRRRLHARLRRSVRELVPGQDGGEGLPEHVLKKFGDPELATRVQEIDVP